MLHRLYWHFSNGPRPLQQIQILYCCKIVTFISESDFSVSSSGPVGIVAAVKLKTANLAKRLHIGFEATLY